MTKRILALCLMVLSHQCLAASSDVPLEFAQYDLSDKASLQRGAKYFMNYCSGCHSLKYLRYSRLAKDFELTTFAGDIDSDLLMNNLIFSKAPIHEPIEIAMPPEDARQWFGTVPPDLSLSARERGPNWIYTYLHSFYKDDSRPFGENNLLIPGVAMPNVLAPLQGEQMAVRKTRMIEFDGKQKEQEYISHLVLVENGSMTQHHFDRTVHDIVNFLVYASDPVKLTRHKIGFFVLIFLFVLLLLAYLIKKIYWKKIH